MLLAGEKFADRMDGGLPSDGRDRLRERDLLGTDFDTVLRVAAIADAAGFHQHVEPIGLERLACFVIVEVARLADRRRADEIIID